MVRWIFYSSIRVSHCSLVGSFFIYDFLHRAIPSLDQYCGKRYGAQWPQLKEDVKWVILPRLC
ncbi:hypothetical protein BX600DRAFT_116262 [Xylariales sp. PMI_506]|nr:hypothetical protein BX600DRAFT_116262 [Xylariales sp. PMI_506]